MAVNRAVRWQKAAILGVGLLGGSLGMALRARGLAGQVVGFVRRPDTAKEAVAVGAVDTATTDLATAVRDADLVVLCTPVLQMALLLSDLAPWLSPGVLVTDVGSVKRAVVVAAEDAVRVAGGHFVGSHPMAGSERTGVGAARADLFVGAVSVVTPTAASDPAAIVAVEDLWREVGAQVVSMSPARHDELVARTSHLPHLVAAVLAEYILAPGHAGEQARLCAAGFRDTTRVASGSPEMWRDIALANRDSVLAALDGFGEALRKLREAVAEEDVVAIETFLRSAKARRDRWWRAGAGGGDRIETE